MGYRNREIEQKFVLVAPNGNLGTFSHSKRLLKLLAAKFGEAVIEGSSSDTYWINPVATNGRAAFVRVRCLGNGRTQMTTKVKDRGNNRNRIEIDVEALDTGKQSLSLLRSLLGKERAVVKKKYRLIHVGNEFNSISFYQVSGDRLRRVFVEVEATSEKKLSTILKKVNEVFLVEGFGMLEIDKSIFETFVA